MRLVRKFGIVCFPVGVVALSSAVAGCFSSSSSDDTVPPTYDGGNPGIDATTPGPDADAPGMAPGMDAGMDVTLTPDSPVTQPEAEAGPLPVTIVVVNDRGPEQGVTVVFQDDQGQPLATADTDATGTASQLVPSGSMVTAVFGTPDAPRLVTVQGVKPGDVLTAYDPSLAPDGSQANVQIDGLPDGGSPDAGQYYAYAGNCYANFTTLPATLYLSAACQSHGKFPLVVVAQDNLNQDIAYTSQTGNVLATDGGLAHVSLSAAWKPIGTATVTATNIPDPPGQAQLDFQPIADGVGVAFSQYASPAVTGGSTASATFESYPGYGTAVQSEAVIDPGTYPTTSVRAAATRSAQPADGGVTFDVTTFLPPIDSAGLVPGSSNRPVVSWTTEGGSLAGTSGTVVMYTWSTDLDGSSVSGTWTIVAPPGVTSVTTPALPAPLAGTAPTSDSSFNSPVIIAAKADFLPGGYDQFRALLASLPWSSSLLSGYQTPLVPPLPVDGTLSVSAYVYSGG
jgi:hypothetical protein